MSEWRPIETYPRELVPPDCYWGETAIFWLPDPGRKGRAVIGHLEADTWLCETPMEAGTWEPASCDPSHWMPLPEPPK